MGLDHGEMSASGQKRRSSRPLVASGLPRLAEDFGTRPWARTELLTALRSGCVPVHHEAAGERRAAVVLNAKTWDRSPARMFQLDRSLADFPRYPTHARVTANSGQLCIRKPPLLPDRTFFARFEGLACLASILLPCSIW